MLLWQYYEKARINLTAFQERYVDLDEWTIVVMCKPYKEPSSEAATNRL